MTSDGISVIVTVPPDSDGRLGPLLKSLADTLRRAGRESEVVVVHPPGVAGLPPSVVAVPLDTYTGFGDSFRRGLDASRHPVVVSVTTDYPYTPDDLLLMVERLEFRPPESDKPTAFVGGCRSGVAPPAVWRLLGTACRLFSRVAFGMPVAPAPGWLGLRNHARAWRAWLVFGNPFVDCDCPFFAVRKSAVTFPLQSQGGFLTTELVAKLTFLTQYLDEVTLTPKPDAVPVADWADSGRVFRSPEFGPAATMSHA